MPDGVRHGSTRYPMLVESADLLYRDREGRFRLDLDLLVEAIQARTTTYRR